VEKKETAGSAGGKWHRATFCRPKVTLEREIPCLGEKERGRLVASGVNPPRLAVGKKALGVLFREGVNVGFTTLRGGRSDE